MNSNETRLGIHKLETAYRQRYTEAERAMIIEEFADLSYDEWRGVVAYAFTNYGDDLPTVAGLWALVHEYTAWRLLHEDRGGGEQPAWKRLLGDAGL